MSGIGGRDTPPSVQDGPLGWEPGGTGSWDDEASRDGAILDAVTAQRIGREVYESSTNWINSSKRVVWNDSLRAFNGKFPSGSKYLSREYAGRSTLYRPKTRTMVRRDEMATAAAFFSNEDVVSIQPGDPDDVRQVASAAIIQELLQYRLTASYEAGGIPWFLTLVGARQDAEVMGLCVAHAYWEYEEEFSHTEMGMDGPVDVMKKTKDQPCVDLLEPENIRFEAGADWRQPLQKSPYIVHLMPMYVQAVMEKMQPQGGKPAEWKMVPKSALFSATDAADDVTRRSREAGRVAGKDHDAWKPRDFDICWVRRNIVRWGGQDWHYYTLGSAGEVLSEPVPLKDVCLHGMRPYVGGFIVLETHKTYPSSKVEIVRDLQRAANDDWNLRFDNVKMALNPRQFVRAGNGVELNDLQRFAPGKTVIINAKAGVPLNGEIMWDRPPEPGASAYAEQDRINLDFDDLTGAFSNSSVQASQIQQQSATGMHLMSGEASGMNEYELRLFAESFVEPLIRLLVKIEQAYETDPVILALAGKNAGLLTKYGINEITDELLNQQVTTRVNVGIGATNPKLRMANLVTVGEVLGKMFGPIALQRANFDEVAKELFGLAGYKDGSRFLKDGPDPYTLQLQQTIQQLQQKAKAPAAPDPHAQMMEEQKLQLDAKVQTDESVREQMRIQLEAAELELNKRKQALEEARFEWEKLHGTRELELQGRAQEIGGKEGAVNGKESDLATKQAAVDEARKHVEALQQGLAMTHHMLSDIAGRHAAGHQRLSAGLEALAGHITAPRRVTRDGAGRVAGVEVVR